MRGDLCLFDYGLDFVIVEDVSIFFLFYVLGILFFKFK